jgi:hypothetical protein
MHTTKWTNPTDKRLVVEIFVAPGVVHRHPFDPGETKELPGEYDNAIHQKHNGVVCGGLAPLLVRKGQSELVHSALIQDGADGNLAAAQQTEITKLRALVEALEKRTNAAATEAQVASQRADAAERRAEDAEAALKRSGSAPAAKAKN